MHEWFCPISLIHPTGWKSIHFEKKLDCCINSILLLVCYLTVNKEKMRTLVMLLLLSLVVNTAAAPYLEETEDAADG